MQYCVYAHALSCTDHMSRKRIWSLKWQTKTKKKKLAIYRSWPWISNFWEWDSNSGLSGIEPRALTTRPRRLGDNLRRYATSCLLFLNQSVLADFDDRKKKLPDLRLVAFQARVTRVFRSKRQAKASLAYYTYQFEDVSLCSTDTKGIEWERGTPWNHRRGVLPLHALITGGVATGYAATTDFAITECFKKGVVILWMGVVGLCTCVSSGVPIPTHHPQVHLQLLQVADDIRRLGVCADDFMAVRTDTEES